LAEFAGSQPFLMRQPAGNRSGPICWSHCGQLAIPVFIVHENIRKKQGSLLINATCAAPEARDAPA
jgi:hypothetical protein